jgi:hypothetical protein
MNQFYSFKDKLIISMAILFLAVALFLLLHSDSFFNYSQVVSAPIGVVNPEGVQVKTKQVNIYFWQSARKNQSVGEGSSVFVGEKSKAKLRFKDGAVVQLSENSLVKLKYANGKVEIDMGYGEINFLVSSKNSFINDCGRILEIDSNGANFSVVKGKNCGDVKITSKSSDIKVNGKKIDSLKGEKFNSLEQDVNLNGFLSTYPKNLQASLQISDKGNLELLGLWQSVSNAFEYEIQLATDEEMKLNTQMITTKENRLQIDDFKQNKIFMQVRANTSSSVKGVFSPVVPAVLKQEDLGIAQINNAQIRDMPENKLSLSLSWSEVPKASGYTLELSPNANFDTFETYKVSENKVTDLDLKNYLVYARVRAQNSVTTGANSLAKKIKYTKPTLQSKNKIKENCFVSSTKQQSFKNQFDISWNPIPLAADYKIELIDSNKKDLLIKSNSRAPASVVDVPRCGNYEVKVIAYDAEGRKISSEFSAAEIVYNTVFSLARPVIASMYNQIDYFFQKDKTGFIRLIWSNTKFDMQSLYNVEIAKDSNFTDSLQKYNTNVSALLLKHKLDEGTYFWRVREQNSSFTSDWSQTAQFNVKVSGSSPRIKEPPQ